jgi:hypothetical protein
MARIDEALYAIVTEDPSCFEQIGNRFYPLMIPQNAALPAACYQTITTQRKRSHQGPSKTPAARMQITIKAASYDKALVVGNVLRLRLDGFKGRVGGVRIASMHLENEYDGFNLDTKSFTVRQDYRIEYYEE